MSNPSTGLRITQIVFSIFFCLFCAGVIFGFAALKPVLIQEGLYADKCLPGERQRDEMGRWEACVDQDTRLNLMFTLASVITNVVCLPVGSTMDYLGPRKTALIGAFIFALGNFFFGLGYRNQVFDSYIIGYILLGIGGPLIFLPQFHLSNAFPAYSGVVLAAITGAFDSSSIPYVFYRMIYDASGGKLNIRLFFWGYLIFPVMVALEQIFVAPGETYQRVVGSESPDEEVTVADAEAATGHSQLHQQMPFPTPPPSLPRNHSMPGGLSRRSSSRLFGYGFEDGASQITISEPVSALSSFVRINYGEAHDNDEEMVKEVGVKDSITGVLYGQTALQQIKSKWFILLAAFVCIHMGRVNFYVMTVDSQLEWYTKDPVLADKLTKAFTLLLPIGGIVGIPIVGLLLDYRPLLEVIIVLGGCGLGFGLFGMTSAAWSQLAGIGLFVLFRPLMYTAISDSFAKVFGFQTFGTVYGLAMTSSGLFGLINAPLDLLVKNELKGDFLPVGFAWVVLGFVSCSALWFIMWRQTRQGAVALA